MTAPQVKGLFLSGGQSQRMGSDKGLLRYRGDQSEIERWEGIFNGLALPFYWSQRPGQYPQELLPGITRLIDQKPGSGPLGAVVSAWHEDPAAAWLVLACDWPLLDDEDVQYLLKERRPDKLATVHTLQGRRQPLFCIYEPLFLQKAAEAWNAGQQSLDRLLQAVDVWELPVLDEGRFLNVNDPTLREQVEKQIRSALSRDHPHQNAQGSSLPFPSS
jgi:molybdopterin-guanine dinucleotide biosynthesis protein A